MKFSNIVNNLSSNIYHHLDEVKNSRLKDGLDVYNFSAGIPDLPVAPHIMEALTEEGKNPYHYTYAMADLPSLTDAVIGWYKTRFGVSLERNEITSTNGTQEGMAHIFFVLCNPGDIVLVPDPGYQVFDFGPRLAGARVEPYPILAENDYLIDFDAIDSDLADKAKVMVVSYPSNPTCSVAGRAFYERLIAFAKKHDIIIIHDNAYCNLVFEGEQVGSILSLPGAKDICIEFSSLSKSYCTPGMRVSFTVGNSEIIQKFKTFRSQIDYGIFLPVQKAALAALTGPQDCVAQAREIYRERRDALIGGLNGIGWEIPTTQATMFCWAPIPPNFQNSTDFCIALLQKTGVICTPGISFGTRGEGYVRFALIEPKEKIAHAVSKIKESGFFG